MKRPPSKSSAVAGDGAGASAATGASGGVPAASGASGVICWRRAEAHGVVIAGGAVPSASGSASASRSSFIFRFADAVGAGTWVRIARTPDAGRLKAENGR